MLALFALFVEAAVAGPPLLSDDPHTIGPGRFEGILAASGFGFSSTADIVAPTADMTLGVFTGVDLTAIVAPLFSVATDGSVETTGTVELGLKWQPLRGEHWNAAFTPTAALNAVVLRGDSNFVLPVQIEYARRRVSIGVDGGYVVDIDNVGNTDLWFLTLYGCLVASESLTLMTEVWTGHAILDEGALAGFTLGLDWTIPGDLHLLASGGPGFGTSSSRDIRWHAYLGLQRRFALWGGD